MKTNKNAHGAGFQRGYEYCQKEYEEKLKNNIEVPDECICSCTNQKVIEMVYPLPPVCDHCRKMIRRSFYNAA